MRPRALGRLIWLKLPRSVTKYEREYRGKSVLSKQYEFEHPSSVCHFCHISMYSKCSTNLKYSETNKSGERLRPHLTLVPRIKFSGSNIVEY